MVTGDEGLNDEALSALHGDLKDLSGKYGKIERSVEGTLISNDEGYKDIVPELRERMANQHGGIGIFIGSGGLLSLLPDLPIDIALLLDKNPAVLEINEVIATLIEGSASPDEVLQRLASPDFRAQNQVLKDIDEFYGKIDIATAFIRKEAREYGEYHWSNPTRFMQVKEALRRKPVAYVATDITSRDFGTALSTIAQHYGERIPFANFTNVHSWIKPTGMDFIRSWPFQTEATVLYSSHRGARAGDWPKMYLAKSSEEYIGEVSKETQN